MKIIREITPAVTEEIEVTFPFFRVQQNSFYYKCLSDKDTVCVTDLGCIFGIKQEGYFTERNIFHPDSKEITEQEFKDKFNEVLIKIQELNQ